MFNVASDLLASWETAEMVRAMATRRGKRLSDKQLHTAQQRGAIAPPKQRMVGRRGSRVFYPPGTANQLARYCTLLDTGATVDEAVWQLWWEGWKISEKTVRRLLAAVIAKLDTAAALQCSLTSEVAAERERAEETLFQLQHQRSRSPLRQLFLARVGDDGVDTLLRLVAKMVTGDLPRLSDQEAAALASAIGGTVVLRDRRVGTGAPSVSSKDLGQMSAALVDLSTEREKQFHWLDIVAARHECRLLWSAAPILLTEVAVRGGGEPVELLAFILEVPRFFQPLLLLVWLTQRSDPRVQAWFRGVQEALQQVMSLLSRDEARDATPHA
jgi:hypothetical protein